MKIKAKYKQNPAIIPIPKKVNFFVNKKNHLRSAWRTAHCVLWCSLAAKPVPIQKCRGMINTQSLLIAPAHPAKSLYPLTSLHTIICLHIQWLFNMYHLKHLKKKIYSAISGVNGILNSNTESCVGFLIAFRTFCAINHYWTCSSSCWENLLGRKAGLSINQLWHLPTAFLYLVPLFSILSLGLSITVHSKPGKGVTQYVQSLYTLTSSSLPESIINRKCQQQCSTKQELTSHASPLRISMKKMHLNRSPMHFSDPKVFFWPTLYSSCPTLYNVLMETFQR